MGGATTAIACLSLNRNYIGFEVNKELKKYHESRIGEFISNANTKRLID